MSKTKIKEINESLTPAERRRLRVRDRILDAAEKVFAQEGISGLSIRRLAASVDYSPAAIYKYFESKEILVDQIRDGFTDLMNEKLVAVYNELDCIKERIERGMTVYIKTAIENPHHYEAVWDSGSGGTDDQTNQLQYGLANVSWSHFPDSERGRGYGLLVELISEGQRSGLFITDNSAEEYAKVLWAGAHGIVMILLQGPEGEKSTNSDDLSVDDKTVAIYAGTLVRSICE